MERTGIKSLRAMAKLHNGTVSAIELPNLPRVGVRNSLRQSQNLIPENSFGQDQRLHASTRVTAASRGGLVGAAYKPIRCGRLEGLSDGLNTVATPAGFFWVSGMFMFRSFSQLSTGGKAPRLRGFRWRIIR